MNIAGLRSIGFAVLLVLLAGAGCNRSKRASSESSAAPTPDGIRASITAHAPDAFYDPPSDMSLQPWRITAERAAQRRDIASRHARLAHPLCNHCGRQHASDGGRDSVRADRSSRRSTSCRSVGARHDGLAAEMHAVAFVDADQGHRRARPDRNGWLGRDRHRLLLRIEGWPASVPDWRRRSARGARFSPCRAADVRAYARQTHGGMGLLAGGHAALWTGIVGPRYAPDLEILGVAAIAPAANIKNILAMNVAVDKRFGPYLALSYSRFYPDVIFEQALRPAAIDAARQIVNLCDFVPPKDPERIEALAATFDGPALATSSNKALQARLDQNTADGPIQAPVVIAQGLSDIVVPPSATDASVEERCSAGQRLEYWTFAGRDHDTIVEPGTPLE